MTTPNSTANHEILDRAVPDRPLVIHRRGEHALWVNAKALALAGITDKPDADPANERFIVRDAAGHPTGILRETAMQLMFHALPDQPLEEKLAILRDAAHYLNQFGHHQRHQRFRRLSGDQTLRRAPRSGRTDGADSDVLWCRGGEPPAHAAVSERFE